MAKRVKLRKGQPTLRPVRADLHIHTVLSACADYRMAPPLIVRTALQRGLDLIAITDHNSGENAGAVLRAAEGTGLTVLPGMELCTREEVHLVALFPELISLLCWQEEVYEALPHLANDEAVFGVQLVVDERGRFLGKNHRFLFAATDLSLEEAVRRITEIGGFCFPAHVDRPAFGLLTQLGFLPQDLDLPAVEISPRISCQAARERFPSLGSRVIIQASDAHRLEDIGLGMTVFSMAEPSFEELILASVGRDGRGVLGYGQLPGGQDLV
ncbi:PHP domain-containing protein [Candidatus Hakubella thermalkaliphila]|uniref:3',5'-nucleoside bisphosphate phosphatase n=1 Tax=Candidatus Hakubella thermalkaliphila TaxID=2754717 RepID=A0A6V8P670_9ACTN|nr:PHP domain-containing protein [Candidatus Hakubella thermalkaliphila]GFP27124.1 3',5'-nucleoside bisphosphate phosphatase [Candidatus Hakubella thermalkaliphila]